MIEIKNLHFQYKNRKALKGVSFSVKKGEIFGLLGPNGSGKTTLFHILSTYYLPMQGEVRIAGFDLVKQKDEVRRSIGVVFQAPSLDPKLTVRENLMHQGHLYGLSGKPLKLRSELMLRELGLQDRTNDMVGKLSGGLKRRVELAKGLLHQPLLLILDEPSTGLDPGVRKDLWSYLKILKEVNKITIVVTTHWMEEAERCDRIAIMNEGELITMGEPDELKKSVGKEVVTLQTNDPESLSRKIQNQFSLRTKVADSSVQIEHEDGASLIGKLAHAFSDEIRSATFRKPTLEDVFMHHTGHNFWNEEPELEGILRK